MSARLTTIAAVLGLVLLAGCGSSSSKSSPSSSGSSGSSSSAKTTSTQAKTPPTSKKGSSTGSGGGTKETIADFKYKPKTITVKAGQSVTWKNTDSSNHTATADKGSFDTGNLQKGDSKSISFSKPGTFKYHCNYHPFMHGTVVVR